MKQRTIWISSVVGAVALAFGGAAIAFATPTPSGPDGTDPDDQVLTGADLDAASEAALAETGGGQVVDSEHDGEGASTYEVEVLLDDGTVSEIELDADFNVTQVDTDDEGTNDADDGAADVDDDSDDGPNDD